MKFTASREALLRPLQLVTGVVEKRQTLPVLSNVLLVVNGQQLSLTGTDLEVELVGRVLLSDPGQDGEVTVPARKLMDICKSLPDSADIEIATEEGRAVLKSGRSRFVLSSLPASEFPNVEEIQGSLRFNIEKAQFKRVIDRTSFAMAQQDVRYYLNGLLLEVAPGQLRSVATDGHRLATCAVEADINIEERQQIIVPRKGVLEMVKLMTEGDGLAEVTLGGNHLRLNVGDYTFTSKLVDGKFPDYERVIPKNGSKFVHGDRQELRQVFSRTAILSNEKYRGVRMILNPDNLQVIANNPEQEQAEESLPVDYQGESLEIGFNVGYLLDVLSVLTNDDVKITLSDPNSSALIEDAENSDSLYVVMPMRL